MCLPKDQNMLYLRQYLYVKASQEKEIVKEDPTNGASEFMGNLHLCVFVYSLFGYLVSLFLLLFCCRCCFSDLWSELDIC